MRILTAFFTISCWFLLALTSVSYTQERKYYQETEWKPRAILPYDDAIYNNFWPQSPAVNNHYEDPGFDHGLLSEVPEPGIHPRVLITPADVEKIRNKIAMGDKAPIPFQAIWKRVTRTQSAFYALVTNNDQLGRALAHQLVLKMHSLEPKLDLLDQQPDRDNLWSAERSIIASGDPDPPSEIWDLLDYDYLYQWLSDEERELARQLISKITYRRISNFLIVPDHFMINNHEGFGMEYIRLMLLIEGEKGFNKLLFEAACHKANAMLDWYLDDDGMCYESIKGWLNISAFVAVGLRQRNLLLHDHLRAKMKFFQAALRWEGNSWKIRDEMRASAFHVIWMMHYYHPNDQGIDFLYRASLSTHPFLTDADAKWPNPVGICNELLLLYADDGILNKEGKPIDWTDQERINSLHLPVTWKDDQRGYLDTRNSWRKDDLHVGFVCKQDFFYGGHEGSENNRLTLWKDGVNWIQDNNMLATKATFLQNMLTVDGKGCHWPPVPGTWLGVHESPEGVVACGDGKDGYSYSKSMQIHPLAYPSAQLGYYAPFTEGNFDLSRDLQVAFNPRTVIYNDGYAHTDYGPWSGETRLVENYRLINPMEQAYRTVQVAKGKHPYLLVIDDAKKDKNNHLFEWNISVPTDVEITDAQTPEIQYQNTEPSDNRSDDIILGKNNMTRDPVTGKLKPKAGDPLCLIRVLWRNTNYGFPVPHLSAFSGYSLVTIPAITVSPEFRVLVYPYRYGEELPTTTWNSDKTLLTVSFKNQSDTYEFAKTDGGRTVFSQSRNGKTVLSSQASPARPVLLVRGASFDASDARYTHEDHQPPVYLIQDSEQVQFTIPKGNSRIYYTLDGSEPTIHSAFYDAPFSIKQTCDLKAKQWDSSWQCGAGWSETLVAHFIVRLPAKRIKLEQASGTVKKGTLAQVYEKSTQLYNNKGFFEASRIMMPDLRKEKPIFETRLSDFALPAITPTHSLKDQAKGFYRFSGYFLAHQQGVYQFDVNSCGPVTFDMGMQTIIEATGVFHQQQQHRKGETVLDSGWHSYTLVICDPLFWNINSLEPMPFDVSYRVNGNEWHPVTENDLCFKSVENKLLSNTDSIPRLPALKQVPDLEHGFELSCYDRYGKRRDTDFLDVDHSTPFHTQKAAQIESSDSRNVVKKYEGYFRAAKPGCYTFLLPYRRGENANLGSLQATCQSQLKIGNQIILQRGVYGRNLSGKINLEKGWYPISMIFGPGEALASVQLPGGQTELLNSQTIFRSRKVCFFAEEKNAEESPFEIYHPVLIRLAYQESYYHTIAIRYTLDGKQPDQHSALYTGPLSIDQSTHLIATAFSGENAISAPSTLDLQLVQKPRKGLLGTVDFTGWDGKAGYFQGSAPYFQVWVSPDAEFSTEKFGKALSLGNNESTLITAVDVNVSRPNPRAGFKLHHIRMRDNALTVAIWFKTNEKQGKIFGKDGYNAFGKGYRTLSCSIENGRLLSSPGHLQGGKLATGEWQFAVVTANESEMGLYLNGVKVATGPGTKDITTDALDFFVGHAAKVASIELFDRLLQPEEVGRLYEFGRYDKL